ncbi:uncharacterized protein LOC136026572 isoform X2 [Artemia franciscana]
MTHENTSINVSKSETATIQEIEPPSNRTFLHGTQIGTEFITTEEIGIVLVVFLLWIGAVILFFNRWGKIRMLEPYQVPFSEAEPDLKPNRPTFYNPDGTLSLMTGGSIRKGARPSLAPSEIVVYSPDGDTIINEAFYLMDCATEGSVEDSSFRPRQNSVILFSNFKPNDCRRTRSVNDLTLETSNKEVGESQ